VKKNLTLRKNIDYKYFFRRRSNCCQSFSSWNFFKYSLEPLKSLSKVKLKTNYLLAKNYKLTGLVDEQDWCSPFFSVREVFVLDRQVFRRVSICKIKLFRVNSHCTYYFQKISLLNRKQLVIMFLHSLISQNMFKISLLIIIRLFSKEHKKLRLNSMMVWWEMKDRWYSKYSILM
jgi:hypothetical protein